MIPGFDIWRSEDIAAPVVRAFSVFERKIFGPNKEDNGTWRIKTNNKVYELIKHRNIINYDKA